MCSFQSISDVLPEVLPSNDQIIKVSALYARLLAIIYTDYGIDPHYAKHGSRTVR